VTCAAFSNPSYSSWCRVTENLREEAQADEVCQGVLRCLNDVDCVKTYCNATTIRGGWKLESVKTEAKKK
jgi:hypothetical protein